MSCNNNSLLTGNKVVVVLVFLLCLVHSSESLRPLFACDPANGLTRTLRFCRVNVPVHARVQDLIGRLTLQEKIRLLVNNAAAVPRLGIGGYEWWSEALHGVSDVGPGAKFGGAFPGATSFPQVITTAASFNQSLWEEIGRVVSDEARAMYNGGAAGLTYWSPNVNILRDPRWGRGQETPGEDPVVAGKYAASYVRGLQGNGAGNRLKVAACCKHYTAYDLDNWNGVDRFHFNAKVTKQDLEDTYNVPFKSCVYEGKVASVMCSYNQVNGKPTCADENLLKNTIRGQWRLNGYIVSDCDSVDVFFNQQHYTTTPEEAAAASIKAGLDLDCGPFLAIFTEGAVKKGLLTENDVNLALANTITVQMRLGMFDGNLGPYANLGPRDVCTPAHQHLALEAAHQGIVLLKNSGRSLPLSPPRHRTIAVIGPNSDVTETMIGNYAGKACAYTSPLQGISRYAKTLHQEGCAGVACAGNQGFGAAEAAARQADATVLVMGLDQSIEAETRDRTGLLLPGYQQNLVTRVAQASRGPVILVLMSGGPVDVSFAKNDPRVAAIIWAGYPGQAGGAAIADIIFGTANPGGKLPMTWYPQDYVTKLPMTIMAMRASGNYPGRTYRFYKGPVVFPFGFGLSYTTFTHTLAQSPLAQLSVSPYKLNTAIFNSSSNSIKVSHANCGTFPKMPLHVEVSNTGEFDGTHTVFVFAEPPENGIKGGLLPNPKLETSVLSVCLSTGSLHYVIPMGIAAAVSTRIANELGAGNPEVARLAVFAGICLWLLEAAICSTILFISRNIFGYAFSNSKEVVDYVTELAPLLCLSFIVDGFSAVLGGVARGSGWQHIGAWANVVAYYLIGAPVGLFLAFWCHMNGKGLWIGVIFGSSSQGIILAIVTACMSWNEQASKARKRIVVGTSSFGNGIA